jgi:hypothetical protein
MTENLGLVALARIQALEVRPEAEEFRAKWLTGQALDADDVVAWLRRELGAGPDEDRFDVLPREVGYLWCGFPSAFAGTAEGQVAYDVESEPLDDLASTALGWRERYGWTLWSALAFALADVDPVILAVEARLSRSLSTARYGVSGPLSERITLVCRPQATRAEVATAYQEAQRHLLRSVTLAPRERTKPMTSPRRVDLAVVGGRIFLGEFGTWAEAMATYNIERPKEKAYREDQYHGRTQQSAKGRFRRDVRDSFRQTTGLDLDFKPDRRGGPATVSMGYKDSAKGWTGTASDATGTLRSKRGRGATKGGGSGD